jgi:twitching motility protein PilT
MVTMEQLLTTMFEKNASDLHLTVNARPAFRLDGHIIQLDGAERLSPQMTQRLVYSLLTDDQKERFERDHELDLSFGVQGLGRVRMNVFMQRGTVAAVLRNIPTKILGFEELMLPPVVKELVKIPKGLVLVTGVTGSGKSTTLAAMIDWINENRRCHILTVEDPIEFLHRHKQAVVDQREVGMDTKDFSRALRQALRQRCDVVLVGEMRDLETINATLTLAETGHLVFATLHTPDAVQSVNRIIDVFPHYQQAQVRAQLSFVLKAVLSQQLLPRTPGPGRVIAVEVLVVTAGVANMIREEKVHQIYSAMQTGSELGMQTMNQALVDLFRKRLVTKAEILSRTTEVRDLERLLKTTGG